MRGTPDVVAVVRDDLSQRTALSKSALATFDYCQTESWFNKHYRLPLIPQEKITFGSATDAAVEAAIKYLRMGQPIDEAVCLEAAAFVVERDGVEIEMAEVEKALVLFVAQVAPHFDWTLCRLQERLSGEIPHLGEVDGHPDLWLSDNRIFDVKTSARGKPDEPSLELGFYALLAQEVAGMPVHEVGYLTYVRSKRPYWEIKRYAVTDELLRWTVEKAAAYVRASRADDRLNAKTKDAPVNWSMTGGPTYVSKCLTCNYAPMCSIARRGEDNADAA